MMKLKQFLYTKINASLIFYKHGPGAFVQDGVSNCIYIYEKCNKRVYTTK